MSEKRLVPDRKVCERYGVTPMTLWRWDHDAALGFPKPVIIRKRKYRLESDLDAFDAAQRTREET
jgi:predicted DNA-binding transcriptional regulator AlpA